MARLIKLEANKTYATEANAIKAVEKKNISDEYCYIVYRDKTTGRYFPVFLGLNCLHAGIHFHFNVVG